MRERKIRTAQQRRAASGIAFSDQGAVWESVDQHLCALEAPSPTRNMVDGHRAAEDRMREYREEIQLPEGASGFLASSGWKVIGLDLFDAPATMHKLWRRLSDAYVVQAIGDDLDAPKSDRALARMFLASVAKRLVPAQSQPELGVELELAGDDVAGAALWHEGALCHLSASAVGG